MLARAGDAGHEIVGSPDKADVLVVNTCGFIDQARQESVDTILELAGKKSTDGASRLVVTGCMAERYAEELQSELPEVDAFVGTGALDQFTTALEAESGEIFRGQKHYLPTTFGDRVPTEKDGSAYLKVSEGCDHECSFCIIPDIRGRHESRSIESIIGEAEALVARGVIELNLVAQDLSAYGRDLDMKDGLSDLLRTLVRVDGIERIRCFYLYPNTVRDSALDAIAELDKVCSYIDMPLQHADGDVLSDMRRARDVDHLYRLIERVRSRLGDPVIRSTFIVGFPTETDRAFANLCRFVEEVRFDRISAFAYSNEDGSYAAELAARKTSIPDHVIEYRRDRLVALQEKISAERAERFIGKTVRVLVCGYDRENGWMARTDGQGPEVDGQMFLGRGGDAERPRPGMMAQAVIRGADAFDLYGDLVWPI